MRGHRFKNIKNGNEKDSPFFQKQRGQSFFGDNKNTFFNSTPIQTKSEENETGDEYAQEANEIADAPVRGSESLSSGIQAPGNTNNVSVQRKCESCEEEEETVQKKPLIIQKQEEWGSESEQSSEGSFSESGSTMSESGSAATESESFSTGVESASGIEEQETSPTTTESGLSSPETEESSENGETGQQGQFIVDDTMEPGPGQMRKSSFLNQLKSGICANVDKALSGTPFSSDSFPSIQSAFASYQGQTASQVEQAIAKYDPTIAGAQSAADLIQRAGAKAFDAAKEWSGSIPGVAGLAGSIGSVASGIGSAVSDIAGSVGSAVAGAASTIGDLFFKSNEGGAAATQSPHVVMQSLGRGHSLDGGSKGKMESAFGSSFSDVEVHTDTNAAKLSANMNARAFTVGNHIAFATGEHKPGTLVGDALMAHELAHVQQQKGAMTNATETNYQTLEESADEEAVGVMSKLVTGKDLNGSGRKNKRLKTGLRLSMKRCGDSSPSPAPPAPAPHDVFDPATGFQKTYDVPSSHPLSGPDANTVQVSPGEKMIFSVEATDNDQKKSSAGGAWTVTPGAGPYEISFSIAGDAEFDSKGSGTTAKTVASLQSGNVYIFIKNSWNKTSAITVTATIKDKAAAIAAPNTGTVVDPDRTLTWNLVKRAKGCPKKLKRISGPGNVWTPAPGVYTYKGSPDIPPAGAPDYEGQTVLERFGNVTALGFTMDDLTDAWKAANPTLNTPNKVAKFLFTSLNGTFVFDANDLIADNHNGFPDKTPFKPSAFNDADGVAFVLPQEYVCGGKVIGSAQVIYRYSTANGLQIKKRGP